MSLGDQLRPWLPHLRQYGSMVLGYPVVGDVVVRRSLEAIVSDPKSFPQDVDARLGLYRFFDKEAGVEFINDLVNSNAFTTSTQQDVSIGFLGPIPLLPRKAALLVSTQGFTVEEASYIIDVSVEEARSAVNDAVRVIGVRSSASVLIIEPEPLISAMMVDILESNNYKVVGVARSERDAVDLALRERPYVIMTESRIGLGSPLRGIERVREQYRPVVIAVTGLVNDVLTSDQPWNVFATIAKPFLPSSLIFALEQAVYLDLNTSKPRLADDNAENVEENAILDSGPVTYAPNAEIKGGVVSIKRGVPEADVSLGRLNALRGDYALDARRLASLGQNLGLGFQNRMTRLADLLDSPISDESSLRIANQSHALSKMRSAIETELLPMQAADITSFINGVELFSKQFPAWREFIQASADVELRSEAVADAISGLINALRSSAEVLSDDFREALEEASIDANLSDDVSSRYLSGFVHNAFAAVARYILARLKGASRSFNEEVDKKVGTGIVGGLEVLFIAASPHLLAMANLIPANWAWAGVALAAIRLSTRRS